jgi:hypothetical protein
MNKSYLIGIFVFISISPFILLSQTGDTSLASSGLEYITLDDKEVMVRSGYTELHKEINLNPVNSFARRVVKRAHISELTRSYAFEISWSICVDQSGKVISSVVKSIKGTDEKELIHKCQAKIFDYLFTQDNNAPKLDCGVFTLKISAPIYQK